MTPAQRYLIVNADDFGLSPEINAGIIEAHEQGIVTSASFMTRGRGAEAAARYARANQRLSVGLHVDLGEWQFADGGWQPVYAVVDLANPAAIADEIRRQLQAFRRLLGRDPTHLDSHQHVHRASAIKEILVRLASELQVPLRHVTPGLQYCGQFYGQGVQQEPYPQAISAASLMEIIAGLHVGLTELACHPGHYSDLQSCYNAERVIELQSLCDAAVKRQLTACDVNLISFAEVPLLLGT